MNGPAAQLDGLAVPWSFTGRLSTVKRPVAISERISAGLAFRATGTVVVVNLAQVRLQEFDRDDLGRARASPGIQGEVLHVGGLGVDGLDVLVWLAVLVGEVAVIPPAAPRPGTRQRPSRGRRLRLSSRRAEGSPPGRGCRCRAAAARRVWRCAPWWRRDGREQARRTSPTPPRPPRRRPLPGPGARPARVGGAVCLELTGRIWRVRKPARRGGTTDHPVRHSTGRLPRRPGFRASRSASSCSWAPRTDRARSPSS